MTARVRTSALGLLGLLLCMLLGACTTERSVELARWDLIGPDARRQLELPATFSEHLPPRPLTYRLRTHVDLPEHYIGTPLNLVIPRFEALTTLRVDGRALEHRGLETGIQYRRVMPQVWQIPADATRDGTLQLELEVEHQWTQSAWVTVVPYLLPAPDLGVLGTVCLVGNVLLPYASAAALVLVGLVYLVIFVSDRSRSTYLWFAIQAISAAYYPFHAGGMSQSVFGVWDTPLLVATLTVALISSVYFLYSHFELGRPSATWTGIGIAMLSMCLLFPGPWSATTVLGPATVALLAFVVVHQIAWALRLLTRPRRRRGPIVFFLAWASLGLFAVPDGVSWLGLGEVAGGLRSASIALIIFAVLQATLIAQEHTESLRDGDRLNAQLAQRVDQLEVRQVEVEQLNLELRRQIGDRSRQLFTALSLVSTRGWVVPSFAPGDVIQGRYRVADRVGSGGMGTVYLVERLADRARFALKIAGQLDPEALARFAREAEIAARVRHPNVVEIVDVDVADAGFFYLVMELVEGRSLDAFEERFGDAPWALPILLHVARGLAALHELSIVHRDIKPANILLVDTGSEGACVAKVADFGISRPAHDKPRAASLRLQESSTPGPGPTWHDTGSNTLEPMTLEDSEETLRVEAPRTTDGRRVAGVTRMGDFVGTPMYMAPELGKGGRLGPPCDMFSFGVLAYTMLTGDLPFESPAVGAVREGHEPRRRPAMRVRREYLDVAVCDLIDCALSLDPDVRPSATDVIEVLERVPEPSRERASGSDVV